MCLTARRQKVRSTAVLDDPEPSSTLQTALCDGEPSNPKFGCAVAIYGILAEFEDKLEEITGDAVACLQ
jgi:hypothetical protein